jgi:TetR/AcrR family transcriptional regulator
MTREEVLKEFRVRELLEAARKVIGRYGFQGTTIEKVAEEAGVAKGTVYLYFTTKEDLMHAAVLEGMRGMINQVNQATATIASPVERLKAQVREHFRVLDSNQDFLKALILERSFAVPNGDEHARELLDFFTGYLNSLADLLRQGVERGELRKIDTQLVAFSLNELVVGSLRRRVLKLADSPLEEDADAILDIILNGVLTKRSV